MQMTLPLVFIRDIWEVVLYPNKEYPLRTGKAPFLRHIAEANKSIQFVEDLESLTQDMIGKLVLAAKRGVEISMVVGVSTGYNVDNPLEHILKTLAREPNIELYQYYGKPKTHVIVVDGKKGGSEKKHKPGQLTRLAFMEEGWMAANAYTPQFNSIKDQSSLYIR